MNRQPLSANTLPIGLLLLALGVPCTFAAAADAAEAEAADDGEKKGPEMSPEARLVGDPDNPDPPAEGSFGPDPSYEDKPYDAEAQLAIYGGRHMNPTARPLFELGRRLYDRGTYTTRPTWLGAKNPLAAHFMAFGDLRVAAAYNDNGVAGANGETHQSRVAARLNLDLDLKITATERIHAFVRPFDRKGSFLRYDIDGRVEDEYVDEFDLDIETLYFEGDIGALATGWSDKVKKYDLPFALGLVPILTQNGVWIEDAFEGVAFALTAKNSPSLNISNFDFTFFAGFNKVTSDAVANDRAANIYGLAGFMDLLEGYLEFGYGYVDAPLDDLSYHNATVAFSKRFGHLVSNSVRLIGNFGQDPVPGRAKTADGLLLLVENSLITSKPSTLIPYINLFAGWDTPQSLARAAGSGGVLRNTGINFETDGLTGFPTLDARGHDSYGGAVGVENLIGLNKRQIIVEVAVVERMSGNVLGSEYALGIRFQEPLTNALLLRVDAMAGWREAPLDDIFGVRLELRRKF